MPADLLRSFRSGDLRALAKTALAQGWDGYMDGGGHVALVNPATGARVVLSSTANARGHQLANVRLALRRGGLVLGPRNRRRSRPAQGQIPPLEVVAMTDPVATDPATAPPYAGTGKALRAGGRYVLVAPKEAVTIAGRQVRIGLRADGRWVADTRDPSTKSGRRQWQGDTDAGREVLEARIAFDLTTGKPPGHTGANDRALGSFVGARIPDPAEAIDVVAAQAVPPSNGAAPGAAWRAVAVDPGEYPIAVALDALEAAVGPALAALEAAGKVDAAALVRGELAMTSAEAELLRLYRRVMSGA